MVEIGVHARANSLRGHAWKDSTIMYFEKNSVVIDKDLCSVFEMNYNTVFFRDHSHTMSFGCLWNQLEVQRNWSVLVVNFEGPVVRIEGLVVRFGLLRKKALLCILKENTVVIDKDLCSVLEMNYNIVFFKDHSHTMTFGSLWNQLEVQRNWSVLVEL